MCSTSVIVTETNRLTYRETDGQTDRQTDRDERMDKQTDRQIIKLYSFSKDTLWIIVNISEAIT